MVHQCDKSPKKKIAGRQVQNSPQYLHNDIIFTLGVSCLLADVASTRNLCAVNNPPPQKKTKQTRKLTFIVVQEYFLPPELM